MLLLDHLYDVLSYLLLVASLLIGLLVVVEVCIVRTWYRYRGTGVGTD